MTSDMSQSSDAQVIPFDGLKGRTLSGLLQLPFVRFHRVQLGFVERPAQYQRFLAEVIGPRLFALPEPLGVFGAGEHSRVLLEAIPELESRIFCFIDNNSGLWGKERFGKLVLSPADALPQCGGIFLSTAVFQHVLRADVRKRGYSGPVVAVDDLVPPSWFLTA